MSSQASYAVYYDSNYRNLTFPNASFSPFPSTLTYHQKRRSRPVFNRQMKNKLYLTSATMPTEEKEEISAVKQSTNDPEVNQPLYQIMKNIDSMEQSINRKIESLQEMGMEGYIRKKLQEEAASKDDNVLATPENSTSMAANVMSTTELKTKAPKRKRSKLLPIDDHDHQRKRQRQKWYKMLQPFIESSVDKRLQPSSQWLAWAMP